LAAAREPTGKAALPELRRRLGQLEDRAAAIGWVWDEALSLRVDAIISHLDGLKS